MHHHRHNQAVRDQHEQAKHEAGQTLEKLLVAAIKVLHQEGLDGATIPAIAAAAGVAPASVYRRFADKDALMREAFLQFLRLTNAGNRQHLPRVLLRRTLAASAERLLRLLFQDYRRHPHLLRALVRFMDADDNVSFRREAHALVAENVRSIADVLMAHREEIRRTSPRRALQFAVLHAASAVEAIALEQNTLWSVVLQLQDEQLARELARAFVAYLTDSGR